MNSFNSKLKLSMLSELSKVNGARGVISNPAYVEMLDVAYEWKKLREYVQDLIDIGDLTSYDYNAVLVQIRAFLYDS